LQTCFVGTTLVIDVGCLPATGLLTAPFPLGNGFGPKRIGGLGGTRAVPGRTNVPAHAEAAGKPRRAGHNK
jgi:hypothetical protein